MLSETYCIDCMEYMRTLPDKAFDLAVVDPPYGIGEGGQKAKSRGKQADFGKSHKSNAKCYSRSDYVCFDDVAPPEEYFWGAEESQPEPDHLGRQSSCRVDQEKFSVLACLGQTKRRKRFCRLRAGIHFFQGSSSCVPIQVERNAAGGHEAQGIPNSSDTKACGTVPVDFPKLRKGGRPRFRYAHGQRLQPDRGV